MGDKKTRVLVAKPGLDGHDRGAKVVARHLRDAGFEVIYMGLRQTPEQIAAAAEEEDADVVGLSILSGAHLPLTRKLRSRLLEKGLDRVKIMVGGTIPQEDEKDLREAGADAIFPTGSRFEDIEDYIKSI
jgi:methylmalonyl-CoA mutase C-terminal domain/subunit